MAPVFYSAGKEYADYTNELLLTIQIRWTIRKAVIQRLAKFWLINMWHIDQRKRNCLRIWIAMEIPYTNMSARQYKVRNVCLIRMIYGIYMISNLKVTATWNLSPDYHIEPVLFSCKQFIVFRQTVFSEILLQKALLLVSCTLNLYYI